MCFPGSRHQGPVYYYVRESSAKSHVADTIDFYLFPGSWHCSGVTSLEALEPSDHGQPNKHVGEAMDKLVMSDETFHAGPRVSSQV